MPNPNIDTPTVVIAHARTHAEAGELLRRPFAPGAIGFRAMTKVTFNGVQYAGAQVAAFLGAQSVVQRLNHVVPGRWQQQFTPIPAELNPVSDRGQRGSGVGQPIGRRGTRRPARPRIARR